MTEATGIPALTIITVPVGKIHPNSYNPNRMSERVYQAERESIREYGFVDPVIVWPHPEIAEEWMVIDGEHRWRAAQDEGLEEIPVTPLYHVTEAEARKLTIILNETRGEADVALLGKLLAQLTEEFSEESLRLGLPYTDDEFLHLQEIGRVDWDDFQQSSLNRQAGGQDAHTVTLAFDAEQYERFATYVSTLGHEWELDAPSAIVLHALGLSIQERQKGAKTKTRKA